MIKYFTIAGLLFPLITLFGEIPYTIEYEGISNNKMIDLLKSVSELESLKKHPSPTLTALTRRIESDIPNLIHGLQTWAYYKPKISFSINTDVWPVAIRIKVDPGALYPLKNFEIFSECEEESPLQEISLEDLGIRLGRPAYPEHILFAENRLLEILAWEGYPLANICSREVIADEGDKTISVRLYINPGPRVVFGWTTIKGLNGVNPLFVCRKICWGRGSPFSPYHIDQTQQVLEESGLFSSVTITPDTEVDESGELPVTIDLIESKHRTVAFGVSYTTQLGPGILAEWEFRNMRGFGERFAILADVWAIRQRGAMMYRQPDFKILGQDILWIGEYKHEKTEGYTDTFFSLTNLIEWQFNNCTKISYGLQFKELGSIDSNNNGLFSLIKIPIYLRWSNANNLLDPTSGHSLNLKLIPTWSILKSNFVYYIQTLVATFYKPLTPSERWVLACKANLGTVFGAADKTIPPPERFYAGNEHTLRGYSYMTVSPLNKEGKPIGGRSLMVYSLELRCRLGEKYGWVAFYEVGNVYKTVLPQFDYKQLQSLGFGLRYCTPVGPLRVDIAVPLDRRKVRVEKEEDGSTVVTYKYIDKPYEFYFSIGQAF